MTARTYRAPRRCGARWREGAPSYVCDVFDSGPGKYADRYTVAFTGPEGFDPNFDWVKYRAMGEAPTHPQGVSLFGGMTTYDFARNRYAEGKRRTRWLDLPEHIHAHVIARMAAD